MTDKQEGDATGSSKFISPSVIIVLVVAALLGGVVLAKSMDRSSTASRAADAETATGTVVPAEGATITSVHNDAVADYEAALRTGKPVYLLFHSLSCEPCVEISAVVDRVIPGYEGKVVFVNAISDDASAQQLASKFQFQYIPTSFFITPDGKVADSFTGAMPETDLKARLDKLTVR